MSTWCPVNRKQTHYAGNKSSLKAVDNTRISSSPGDIPVLFLSHAAAVVAILLVVDKPGST